MIRLTSKYTNNVWYVNPDHIISIGCINGGTTVELTTDIETDAVRHVTESPAEVARKVLEYRLAMERYRAGVFAEATALREDANTLAWARNAEYRIMLNLAGLEDMNHDAG